MTMRHRFTLYVVLVAMGLFPAACMAPAGTEIDQQSEQLVSVARDEVPAEVAECRARFGVEAQWPRADAVYRVEDTEEGLLVSEGAVQCTAPVITLVRLHQGELARDGVIHPIYLTGSAASPADDSNPLPAKPGGPRSASAASGGGVIDDSNPLPAGPLPNAEKQGNLPLLGQP
jgi:hypothetical protein